MDSQLHEIHSFTTLLQEEEESYNDYLPSLNDLESQYTPSNPENGNSKKTKSRKDNFSIEEDNLLVLAWLNTSMDPINQNIHFGLEFMNIMRQTKKLYLLNVVHALLEIDGLPSNLLQISFVGP